MKKNKLLVRKLRVAQKVRGTPQRPRLSATITLRHIYAQVIDDEQGHTLASTSTFAKELSHLKVKDNLQSARLVGEFIAQKALEKGISQVVFDRGYRRFCGRIKALAEAARQKGLHF